MYIFFFTSLYHQALFSSIKSCIPSHVRIPLSRKPSKYENFSRLWTVVLTATVARKPSTPYNRIARQPLRRTRNHPRRNKVRSLTTRRRVQRNIVWIQQREGAVTRGGGVADGCIVSSARVLSSFLLVRPSRGSRMEKKKRGGWKTGAENAWQPLGSLSLSLSFFLSFSAASANRGGRKQSTNTHTHTVCRIYSKASRAFARCTKRKLSCRPEINYRVSRGWIRNVLSSTITPGVKGCCG